MSYPDSRVGVYEIIAKYKEENPGKEPELQTLTAQKTMVRPLDHHANTTL